LIGRNQTLAEVAREAIRYSKVSGHATIGRGGKQSKSLDAEFFSSRLNFFQTGSDE
jgi:hypothetical protein